VRCVVRQYSIETLRKAWGAGRGASRENIDALQRWNLMLAKSLFDILQQSPPTSAMPEDVGPWIDRLSNAAIKGWDALDTVHDEVMASITSPRAGRGQG